MAVTSQAIPAAELVDRAADCPVVIGRNLVEIAYKQAAAQLLTNEVGNVATGDHSLAGYDRRRLTQRFKHRLWKGDSSGTVWYVVVDVGTDEQWTDALVIGPGHNLAGLTVTVEADSTTPSGDPWGTTILSGTIGASTVATVLLHASTMYKARYWRISIDGGTFTPEATSFWLGKAIQFPTKPLFSSSPPNTYAGGAIEHVTTGGIPYRYITQGALRERDLAWMIDQNHAGSFFSNADYGLDDFFVNDNALYGGNQNFWYVDEPTTAPNSALLVRLGSARHRPMLKRGGSGDAGATLINWQILEVGG